MSGRTTGPPAPKRAVLSPDELGSAAVTLARRLAADAVFDRRGAPQWTGDQVDVVAGADGSILATGPVDDGLLTGRAGIALALAEAASYSGDEAPAMLAAATLADVIDRRRAVARGELGWQSGDMGIAIAAERVAELLDRPDIALGGRGLAARAVAALATDDSRLPGYADLLDGSAGHLLAVLAATLPPDAEPHRAAASERLVHDLRTRVVADGAGARWPMADGDRAVTGLAHGSSGIGLALLAAAAAGVAGADPALAEAAWMWEDAGYGAEDGGWYDLRVDEPAIGLAWCHGAPGIGIAAALRSRVGDARGAAGSEATYVRALRSIQRARREFPDDADDDATLCHGRSGVVELHLAGAEAAWPVDAASREEHRRAARDEASVIAAGIDPDGTTSWRHGVRGGRSPAVLDGTAGVVLTLLRCADPIAGLAHPPLRFG